MSTNKMCTKFFTGNCAYGDHCKYSHEYIICKFDENCRNKKKCYYCHHDKEGRIVPPQFWKSVDKVEAKSYKTNCINFQAYGFCEDPDCDHSHEEHVQCYHFSKGHCSRENCMFWHGDEEPPFFSTLERSLSATAVIEESVNKIPITEVSKPKVVKHKPVKVAKPFNWADDDPVETPSLSSFVEVAKKGRDVPKTPEEPPQSDTFVKLKQSLENPSKNWSTSEDPLDILMSTLDSFKDNSSALARLKFYQKYLELLTLLKDRCMLDRFKEKYWKDFQFPKDPFRVIVDSEDFLKLFDITDPEKIEQNTMMIGMVLDDLEKVIQTPHDRDLFETVYRPLFF